MLSSAATLPLSLTLILAGFSLTSYAHPKLSSHKSSNGARSELRARQNGVAANPSKVAKGDKSPSELEAAEEEILREYKEITGRDLEVSLAVLRSLIEAQRTKPELWKALESAFRSELGRVAKAVPGIHWPVVSSGIYAVLLSFVQYIAQTKKPSTQAREIVALSSRLLPLLYKFLSGEKKGKDYVYGWGDIYGLLLKSVSKSSLKHIKRDWIAALVADFLNKLFTLSEKERQKNGEERGAINYLFSTDYSSLFVETAKQSLPKAVAGLAVGAQLKKWGLAKGLANRIVNENRLGGAPNIFLHTLITSYIMATVAGYVSKRAPDFIDWIYASGVAKAKQLGLDAYIPDYQYYWENYIPEISGRIPAIPYINPAKQEL